MPRQLKLASLQPDILMMLEEAGAETVGTVVTTLRPPHGEFTVQVDQLVTLGLIPRVEDSADRTGEDHPPSIDRRRLVIIDHIGISSLTVSLLNRPTNADEIKGE